MKTLVLKKTVFFEDILITRLKTGIWLYFFLLIFEGALRKWVFPGLSEPLLIIRDPLAIWLLILSWKYGIWKPNSYVLMIWAISILALISTLLVGHGDMKVALYGLRITLIQFPLIFVIGTLFKKNDVIVLGKIMLWITIGMTVLVAVQFYSPQSAWVNRGIGGDMEGSGFSGAAGFYRVPGTFSFTNGLSLFYGMAAAFIFYFWIEKKKQVNNLLLIISTLALLAAIPLSISRTLLFYVALTFAFTLVIAGKNPKVIIRLLIAVSAGIFLFSVLGNFSFFQKASFAFGERFSTANEIEGGLDGVFIDRFLGGMYGALTDDSNPFFGMGVGMGTNAGAKILMGDQGGVFLISEGEWGRVIGEMGMILGLVVIFIRLSLVVYLARKAWESISFNNILPWMLLSFGLVNVLQGQWAQPTTLGFGVLIGGIILSSIQQTAT